VRLPTVTTDVTWRTLADFSSYVSFTLPVTPRPHAGDTKEVVTGLTHELDLEAQSLHKGVVFVFGQPLGVETHMQMGSPN
jgi:hypothetical protein